MIGDRAVKSVVWDQLQHIGIIWEIKSFPGHKRLENWAEGSKKALPLIIKFGASRDYVALKSHAIDNNEERNEMGERNKNRKESRKKAKEGQ